MANRAGGIAAHGPGGAAESKRSRSTPTDQAIAAKGGLPLLLGILLLTLGIASCITAPVEEPTLGPMVPPMVAEDEPSLYQDPSDSHGEAPVDNPGEATADTPETATPDIDFKKPPTEEAPKPPAKEPDSAAPTGNTQPPPVGPTMEPEPPPPDGLEPGETASLPPGPSPLELEENGVPDEPIPPPPEPEVPAPESPAIVLANTRVGAYAKYYPGRITGIETREDDVTFLLDKSRFWYAGGRYLPDGERKNTHQWAALPWYPYPRVLQDPPGYTKAEEARLQDIARTQGSGPPRNNTFLNTLWSGKNQDQTWQQMRRVYFLGKKVTVHREILAALGKVDSEIKGLAKSHSSVKAFMADLKDVQGYNWRTIAGTTNRSMHSYGMAIDLVPRSWRGKWVYWQWPIDTTPWYRVKLRDRYSFPPEVVTAFENHGFTWGGKWTFFDIMHFEYRPELLLAESH